MAKSKFFIIEKKNLKLHRSNCPLLLYKNVKDHISVFRTRENEIHLISTSDTLTEKEKEQRLDGLGYKYLGKFTKSWEAMIKAILYYIRHTKDSIINKDTYEDNENSIKGSCIRQGINKTSLSHKEHKDIIINAIIEEIQEKEMLNKVDGCEQCCGELHAN